MAYTPSTAAILRKIRREQGRPLRENAADIGIHLDRDDATERGIITGRQLMMRDWVNNPCEYGCDCGECYSRSPNQTDHHHCTDRMVIGTQRRKT